MAGAWHVIGKEHGTAEVPPSTRVRYGAGTRWSEKLLWGTFKVINELFGDPAPGVGKQAERWVEPGESAIPPAPGTWQLACRENETAELPPQTRVRYGLGASWVEAVVGGRVRANNAAFGDVVPGKAKVLERFYPAPIVDGPGTWAYLGTENSLVEVAPSTPVRYGSKDRWVYKVVWGRFAATNDLFGDPLPGTAKQVEQFLSATPKPQPQGRWLQVCPERGTADVRPGTTVRYGYNSTWVEKIALGPIVASNDVFGDPLVGTRKVLERFEPYEPGRPRPPSEKADPPAYGTRRRSTKAGPNPRSPRWGPGRARGGGERSSPGVQMRRYRCHP